MTQSAKGILALLPRFFGRVMAARRLHNIVRLAQAGRDSFCEKLGNNPMQARTLSAKSLKSFEMKHQRGAGFCLQHFEADPRTKGAGEIFLFLSCSREQNRYNPLIAAVLAAWSKELYHNVRFLSPHR
jgi:hypothetical protein